MGHRILPFELLSWACMVNDDNDERNFEEHSFSRSNLSNVLWTVHDMSNLDPGRFVLKGTLVSTALKDGRDPGSVSLRQDDYSRSLG